MLSRPTRGWYAALLTALVCGLLGGCKSDSAFSKEEMQQLKEGPPKQMPAQARELMSRMGQAGNQGAPPRPVGQPGPAGPGGAAPNAGGGMPSRPVGQPGPAGPGGR